MARQINLDIKDILSLPLTTNRINVTVDKKVFLEKYDIVSYYGLVKGKNLAYEYLSDEPTISIAGIRARYDKEAKPYTKFFVMVRHGESGPILKSLRDMDSIRSCLDNLENYTTAIQKRIIASLAINSLGKGKREQAIYNNGKLLLCDNQNFNIAKYKKELVCLSIEINEYMVLTARTITYSHPSSLEQLKKHKYGAFMIGKDMGGSSWMGNALKPAQIKGQKISENNLDKFFIQKKRFNHNRNLVPYWPYNPDNYIHGKLFALWQVVDSVNEAYSQILHIDFTDYPVLYYDEYKTDKDMTNFIKEYLNGKSIIFENPFKEDGAKKIIEDFKEIANELIDGGLSFPQKAKGDEMQIRLCEPIDANVTQSNYSRSIERMVRSGNALQHVIFHNNEKEDAVSKSETRRILIELIVKDCLVKGIMPTRLQQSINGWTFYRYKIREGGVHGASLTVGNDGTIGINNFGVLANNLFGESLESFANMYFHYNHSEKINGYRDYKALTKDGNSYLIIDTDEIPILDVAEIDEGYGDIVNKGEKLSMFKRKKEAHKYLRGYIGFHLWETEGLDGDPYCSYSYISGNHPQNMQILHSGKMDKMPRARRIFILHEENPDTVKDDIHEIADMMRYGFGRWNEGMTYPFPFKYLYEYLDNECEIRLSKHWDVF